MKINVFRRYFESKFMESRLIVKCNCISTYDWNYIFTPNKPLKNTFKN